MSYVNNFARFVRNARNVRGIFLSYIQLPKLFSVSLMMLRGNIETSTPSLNFDISFEITKKTSNLLLLKQATYFSTSIVPRFVFAWHFSHSQHEAIHDCVL